MHRRQGFTPDLLVVKAALVVALALACLCTTAEGLSSKRNSADWLYGRSPSLLEAHTEVWLGERDCPTLCNSACQCITSRPNCNEFCTKCLTDGIPCGLKVIKAVLANQPLKGKLITPAAIITPVTIDTPSSSSSSSSSSLRFRNKLQAPVPIRSRSESSSEHSNSTESSESSESSGSRRRRHGSESSSVHSSSSSSSSSSAPHSSHSGSSSSSHSKSGSGSESSHSGSSSSRSSGSSSSRSESSRGSESSRSESSHESSRSRSESSRSESSSRSEESSSRGSKVDVPLSKDSHITPLNRADARAATTSREARIAKVMELQQKIIQMLAHDPSSSESSAAAHHHSELSEQSHRQLSSIIASSSDLTRRNSLLLKRLQEILGLHVEQKLLANSGTDFATLSSDPSVRIVPVTIPMAVRVDSKGVATPVLGNLGVAPLSSSSASSSSSSSSGSSSASSSSSGSSSVHAASTSSSHHAKVENIVRKLEALILWVKQKKQQHGAHFGSEVSHIHDLLDQAVNLSKRA